jgi:hypothetical protein
MTYALVARSVAPEEEKGMTKKKVMEAGSKVGPVKVKGVRELKDGGVAIIAQSAGDVRKIREATAFKEAGLKLSEPKMAEARLVVSDVPAELTNEVLIGEVFKNNLQGRVTDEELGQIRVATRTAGKGGKSMVFIEAPSRVRKFVLAEGRVYVGFSSLRVREYEDVPRCYGCGSFNHVLARCALGRLCRNCGQADHSVDVCTNPANCRNCAVRGLDASHRVTSSTCPCFLREAERRRGRVIG